ATTASISAMERPICSSSSTCIDPGARSRSLSGERQKITPNACASSSMSMIPMRSTSGLYRITYRPTQPAPCTRHFRPPKPGAFCDGWSSTTPPSTQVGSTWSKSRSECCAANASTDASIRRSSSNPRSLPGNVSAMPQARASNGCSQPRKLEPKWDGPTHSPLPSARLKPKSHNNCAAVLVTTPAEFVAQANSTDQVVHTFARGCGRGACGILRVVEQLQIKKLEAKD